jgi:hypothetical protein
MASDRMAGNKLELAFVLSLWIKHVRGVGYGKHSQPMFSSSCIAPEGTLHCICRAALRGSA